MAAYRKGAAFFMGMPFALRAPLELDVDISLLGRRLLARAPSDAPWTIAVAGDVAGDLLSCVRGAWDLFLQAKDLPRGSEVILSGINIRHMEDVVRAHGLVPVAADLDAETLLPSAETLRRLRTPKTVGVLVAHLFGAWSPLDSLATFCRDEGLFLVEDCAQAFMGRDFTGTRLASASFFSFGTIKRCTAFGGAVAFVREDVTRSRMVSLAAEYPLQDEVRFRRKMAKYLGLKLLSGPRPYAAVAGALKMIHGSHEEVLRNAVRGFPGASVPQAFRFRPCAALRSLVAERWHETDLSLWTRRSQEMWAEFDRVGILRERVAGQGAFRHTFWLVPLRSRHPDDTMRVAAQGGLDATRGVTSLSPVGDPIVAGAADILKELVYLPVHQRRILDLGQGLAGTL